MNQIFSRFFKARKKTWLKPGKLRKKRLKPRKSLLENVESTHAESWGSGDVVTDRGRTTHVPARGKSEKNPDQFFTDPLLTDPFWPVPRGVNRDRKGHDSWVVFCPIFLSARFSCDQFVQEKAGNIDKNRLTVALKSTPKCLTEMPQNFPEF